MLFSVNPFFANFEKLLLQQDDHLYETYGNIMTLIHHFKVVYQYSLYIRLLRVDATMNTM